MKKILTILGATSLIVSTSAILISCSNNGTMNNKNDASKSIKFSKFTLNFKNSYISDIKTNINVLTEKVSVENPSYLNIATTSTSTLSFIVSGSTIEFNYIIKVRKSDYVGTSSPEKTQETIDKIREFSNEKINCIITEFIQEDFRNLSNILVSNLEGEYSFSPSIKSKYESSIVDNFYMDVSSSIIDTFTNSEWA